MPAYRSLSDFNKQCSGIQNSLRRSMAAGVNAAALLTKGSVLEAAQRQAWPRKRVKGKRMPVVVVHYRITSTGENPTAWVRLVNGHLYELGSYLHPSGWEITPRGVTRRRAALAAKRGQSLTQKAAVVTPYGPFAKVHHPPMRGRPFWDQGVLVARPKVEKVFGLAVVKTLAETFK